MKKKCLAALALAIALLAGCGAPAEFDESQLVERSKGYAQNMAAGDFAAVAEGFSQIMAAQLDAAALEESWDSVADGIGAFEAYRGESYGQTESNATVALVCDFENNGLKLTFVYNGKGEIDGLWMTYAPKDILPQSTESYTERAAKIGSPPLNGMLTLPEGKADAPAVLMIQGSGANDMDETIGASANKPFADIAHGLAEVGIASLRYNKRNFQYPDERIRTVYDEVIDDAQAAYEWLKEQPGVGEVYILGHSLGGMLTPEIARQTGAAGMISLAGSPRSLADIIYDQNQAAVDAAQLTDAQKRQAMAQVELLAQAAKSAKEDDETLILGYPGSYWHSLNAIDTAGVARSLSIPMLFLQGEEDFQVDQDKDFGAWRQALEGRDNAAFISYPGLNHLFMPGDGTRTTQEYNAPARVDGRVISDIAAFISGE